MNKILDTLEALEQPEQAADDLDSDAAESGGLDTGEIGEEFADE